ncbi:AbrB family transcriptional regulator [Sulfolobus acidocaldarius]|nr:AbrB/MazE/SpoVT family DNA-binding domain-containing protein [Sulfolobus acidocaldarius]ALU28581.1 AbrB family transcriptional regulator [Sulfolobus acidocaldarius]ALU31294.1 AbrB family transcriptional regulator [Sulfolobus acidocaldarius]
MMVEDIVKVSRNFQITIPVRIRKKFPIKEGDLVKVIYDEKDNTVRIVKITEEELR